MKVKIKYLISLLLMVGLFSSCQKQELTKMMANPIAPEITSMPNLTLERANGTDTLTFKGSAVNPGFQASAIYYLEACPAGDKFANPISIMHSDFDKAMKITISDLNSILLKKFPADTVSSIDFRIRAVLAVDAGTGAPGTGTNLFQYSSKTKNADVTIYGLPRLDLIGSGMTQKIVSALGDGSYTGMVKLDPAKPFKLHDPDNDTTYGAGSSTALVADGGNGIVASGIAGWYNLSANIKALTYKTDPYMISIIGDAAQGWATDEMMDYDPQTDLWSITIDLTAGSFKFRLNGGWGNGINLGLGDASHPQYTLDNLWNDSGSQNIPVAAAGNYTITLSIGTSTYKATITKNN